MHTTCQVPHRKYAFISRVQIQFLMHTLSEAYLYTVHSVYYVQIIYFQLISLCIIYYVMYQSQEKHSLMLLLTDPKFAYPMFKPLCAYMAVQWNDPTCHLHKAD